MHILYNNHKGERFYVCLHVSVCECRCAEAGAGCTVFPCVAVHLISLVQVSHRLSAILVSIIQFHPVLWNYRHVQLCPVFLVGFRDLNSKTCACTTDTLHTELSPNPIKVSIL